MHLVKSYLEDTPESAWQSDAIAMLAAMDHLKITSPRVAKGIMDELTQQRASLKLIASENYSTLSCQLAMANWLTDKYAEGIPHHRFYAGCENIDALESLAVERAKELFGSDHAFVQPHSGADANLLAIFAVLIQRVQTPLLNQLDRRLDDLSDQEHEELRKELGGQCMLAMSLSAGGHLTHGYRQNITSKIMRCVAYGVDEKTHLLNYDKIAAIARRERPLILMAGFSAYTRKIDFSRLREIADEVGATLIVDMAHFAGLIAGGVFEGIHNPIPFADIVTSTTHKTLRGPRGGVVLCKEAFRSIIDKACPLIMGGPLPHVVAAKAIAFEDALKSEFAVYAHQIVKNAKSLAHQLSRRGIDLLTGGTDNHQVILDISTCGLNGRQAELALRQAGIVCNRNLLPFDRMGAWYTSGLRFGTAALTTLGMKEAQMTEIADLTMRVLTHTRSHKEKSSLFETDERVVAEVHGCVRDLCEEFPLYPQLPMQWD